MSRKKVLTDKGIIGLQPAPEGQRYIAADTIVPGLGVRVTNKGHKTFVLGARYPGSKHFKRREIGEVGTITLSAAREKARGWLELIKAGRDPREEEQKKKEAAAEASSHTFKVVAEAYIKLKLREKRTGEVVARNIRNQLIPAWGARPIGEITRRDVVVLLEKVADRGRTGAFARNMFEHTRAIFNWAINRTIYGLEHSPCDRLKPTDLIGAKRVRKRVLTDDELRAVWRAAARTPYPYGPLIQLLLLTGTRLREAANAARSEFELGNTLAWTIPAERFKSDAEHVLPMTPTMVDFYNSLPRHKRGNFVFSFDGTHPIDNFHRAKKKFDTRVLRTWRALGRVNGTDRRNADMAPWTHHDLRRTVRTRLGALKVPRVVSELVIGHGKRGLDRVYDQHEYAAEIREALETWQSFLLGIVDPPPTAPNNVPDNVVPLRRQA